MLHTDTSNQYFDLAVKFVNQTSINLFLTGKAGTGKTTFLKYIKETCPKKMVVVAPTGVAAMNAGGVTIHSFFQLPLGNFIPDQSQIQEGNFYNRSQLLKHLRLTSSKRKLIQEMELLIIDEVSMVRADLLDALDVVLKVVRKKTYAPFGGVQVVFIGDLFQLPPVVQEQEWQVLNKYYTSPFFFHARTLQNTPPLYLELKKIYRQKDEVFIHLLNNLRNNCISDEDILLLNSYYNPDFKPEIKGEYITLTTHNYKADQINQSELAKLSGKAFTFNAKVEGEFYEKSYPTEEKLQLKEGAQVLFIRNDKGEERRYYNGKIGSIQKLTNNEIIVVFPNEPGEFKIERETWKNVKYKYNSETDQVEEEVLGTFSQYPIRLAWAITIHKSQGLTFTKAIIDAGESFAPGQVYVALSRLTSLDGLVLFSKIHSSAVSTDQQASHFATSEQDTHSIIEQLNIGQRQYVHDLLLNVYNWQTIQSEIESLKNEIDNKKLPHQSEAKSVLIKLATQAEVQLKTANKFILQLKELLEAVPGTNYDSVHNRITAAGNYFSENLNKEIFLPLENHYEKTRKLSKVKKYLRELDILINTIRHKQDQLKQAEKITAGLIQGSDPSSVLQQLVSDKKEKIIAAPAKVKFVKEKLEKGASHKISLELFRQGKSIIEIAEERGLAIGTIEGHLISFIGSGNLQLEELVSKEKIEAISKVIELLGDVSSTLIKEKLGEEFTYGEIRAVINSKKENKVTS